MHTDTPGDWVLTDETVDAAGRPVALPAWFTTCLPEEPARFGGTRAATGPADGLDACFRRLGAEAYRQHVAYQPRERFRTLQWLEAAAYLTGAAAVAAGCFWWVRRRLG